MKKQITLALLFAVLALTLPAQNEFKPSGSGIGTVFFNYKYDLARDIDKRSSFNLERAYLGYKYDFAKNISGKVIFDVSYDPALKSFTAFAKNAFLDWKISPMVKLSVGLIPFKHFELQDNFWGYRYIIKTFTDEYGMGTTADLGVNVELPVSEMLTFNVFMINGEGFKGYKSWQDDYGMHKFGANATLKPSEGWSFRVHYDLMPNKYQLADTLPVIDTSTISVFTAFAGYEVKEHFRIGAEYNLMNNGINYRKLADEHQLSGLSVFGTYIIDKQFEIFARYDYLTSNTIGNADDGWNFNGDLTQQADGSMVMAGVQYKPIKGVNFALNYRTFMHKNSDIDAHTGLYLNLGLMF